MHEFAITSYLVEAVDARARELAAKRVLAINLVVGDGSGIVDDSLRFYFDMLAPGTAAEGAVVNVRRTGLRFSCRTCGREYEPTGYDFGCPDCGQLGEVINSGDDLMIESLEIEA